MRNIALKLMYVGTAYHGWQIQKNGATVQETLQDALATVVCPACSRAWAMQSASTWFFGHPKEISAIFMRVAPLSC